MNKYSKTYIETLLKTAKPTIEVDLPSNTTNPITSSALSAVGHGEAPKLPGMGLDRPRTWGESLAVGLAPRTTINGKLQMPDLNDPMLQQAQSAGKLLDTGIIGKIQSLLTGRK